MKKIFMSVSAIGLLAGCANLAEVNGIAVNQDLSNLDAAQLTYCERQPAVCILAAAVVVGLVASSSDTDTVEETETGCGDSCKIDTPDEVEFD